MAYDQSLMQLLASPDAFYGKRVSVQGFVRPEPGGGAGLYLHPEHAAHRVRPNGLWLDLPPGGGAGAAGELGGGSVQVEGVLRAGRQDLGGAWGGVIVPVTRLEARTGDPRRRHLAEVNQRRAWLRVRRRGVACPHCGNAEKMRHMDTENCFGAYFICGRCGRSFVPAGLE